MKNKQIGIAYNFSEQKTHLIYPESLENDPKGVGDLSKMKSKVFYEEKLSGYFSRIIRTDKDNENIFLRSGVKEITILNNVSHLPYPKNKNQHFEDVLKVVVEEGTFIIDF